jgi:hypothetical protein
MHACRYKADHQKHCPHCGLLAQWTDGCSSMTCGRDASDKGGAIHSVLGCGKQFSWDTAPRYQARFQDFTASAGVGGGGGGAAGAADDDPIAVRLTGVQLPARLCRLCFQTVGEGTCFEELSAQAHRICADPLALLEYVQLKSQRVCAHLTPAVFEEGPAFHNTALPTLLLGTRVADSVPLLMLDRAVTDRFSHPACAAVRLLTDERAAADGRPTHVCETCGGRCVWGTCPLCWYEHGSVRPCVSVSARASVRAPD